MSDLQPFDGLDVLGATIVIKGAGDGLSKALSISPREFHLGDEFTVAVRCKVANVGFDPVKDTSGVLRKHTAKASTATIIDEAVVEAALVEQERKLEEAQGIQRIPFEGEQGENPDGDGSD